MENYWYRSCTKNWWRADGEKHDENVTHGQPHRWQICQDGNSLY